MKQTEILTHATHVNSWFPAVYTSCMSQNFRLFHVSNLSVRNFRIFLLMYTGSWQPCTVPPSRRRPVLRAVPICLLSPVTCRFRVASPSPPEGLPFRALDRRPPLPIPPPPRPPAAAIAGADAIHKKPAATPRPPVRPSTRQLTDASCILGNQLIVAAAQLIDRPTGRRIYFCNGA